MAESDDRVIHRLALLLLLLSLSSCHAGIGPTVGHRFEDNVRLGWEASAGYVVASGSIGQTFSLGDQPDTLIYVAAEPGAGLGATLGVDYANGEDWGFMPGGWVGVPTRPLRFGGPARSDDIFGMQPVITIALGYRYAHGHDIYFAPKLFLYEYSSNPLY